MAAGGRACSRKALCRLISATEKIEISPTLSRKYARRHCSAMRRAQPVRGMDLGLVWTATIQHLLSGRPSPHARLDVHPHCSGRSDRCGLLTITKTPRLPYRAQRRPSIGVIKTPLHGQGTCFSMVKFRRAALCSERRRNILSSPKLIFSASRASRKPRICSARKYWALACASKPLSDRSSVHPPSGRGSAPRHSTTPSGGSSSDVHSVPSDASADRDFGTPLRQIVAIYNIDDGRPWFAFEVITLDDETNQVACMTLQFNEPEDRDFWLASIRFAANKACLADDNPISAHNSHLAARVVERDGDYDPNNYAIFKVVQRYSGKSSDRSSSDDLVKIGSTACFLAIGIHKAHLIPLFKSSQRASSPALGSHGAQGSYGVLSLAEIRLNHDDDVFDLTFR